MMPSKHINLNWKSHGLVLKPSQEIQWMQSHIAVPCVEHIESDLFRLYFCARDSLNRSQIGYADIDIRESLIIRKISKKPILGLGPLGCFDDNGVTPTWVLKKGSKKYLYYVGWNKGTTVRMHLYVGLAISIDGENFVRYSNAPILERVKQDPYLTATLSILREKGIYRMWYVSGDRWFSKGEETFPVYNIKYAESKDGIHWDRKGKICIDYKSPEEHALARPCVVKDSGLYKMWYSYKGNDYKLGYAESKDGIKWKRLDHIPSIAPPTSDHDNKMQEYAFVFIHKGKKHMFYNGNEYGKNGLLYATCDTRQSSN